MRCEVQPSSVQASQPRNSYHSSFSAPPQYGRSSNCRRFSISSKFDGLKQTKDCHPPVFHILAYFLKIASNPPEVEVDGRLQEKALKILNKELDKKFTEDLGNTAADFKLGWENEDPRRHSAPSIMEMSQLTCPELFACLDENKQAIVLQKTLSAAAHHLSKDLNINELLTLSVPSGYTPHEWDELLISELKEKDLLSEKDDTYELCLDQCYDVVVIQKLAALSKALSIKRLNLAEMHYLDAPMLEALRPLLEHCVEVVIREPVADVPQILQKIVKHSIRLVVWQSDRDSRPQDDRSTRNQ